MKIHKALPLVAILFLICPRHSASKQNQPESSRAIEALLKVAEQGNVDSKAIFCSGRSKIAGIETGFNVSTPQYRVTLSNPKSHPATGASRLKKEMYANRSRFSS
jgi:hypothetical protein